jgi:hypothetical protein
MKQNQFKFNYGRQIMRSAIKYVIIISIIVLLLLVGIILAAIFHVLLPFLYIVLIVLATLSLAGTFLQIYWVVTLIRTVLLVRNEVQPLLASVQETVGAVKDTAQTAGHTVSTIGNVSRLFSEFALGPSVRIVAGLVAAQQVLGVLLGKGHARNRAEQRRRQQMEAGVGGD